MKNKRSVYNNPYEKKLNNITSEKECFRIFKDIEEDDTEFDIDKFITQIMKEYSRLGRKKAYEKFSLIKKYRINYKVLCINPLWANTSIDEVKSYENHLRNKDNSNFYDKSDYIYKNELNNVINDNSECEHIIINPNDDLSYHINGLTHYINANEIDIAVGYLFNSGLAMIANSLNYIFQNDNKDKKVKFIIGSLQNYYKGTTNNKVNIDINLETINQLNYYSTLDMDMRTLKEKFYHGKLFILKGEKVHCIIIGSSNVSRSAFNNNYELNELIIFKNNSVKFKPYCNYFNDLWDKCYQIDILDSSIINFGESDRDKKINNFTEVNYDYVVENIIKNIDDTEIKLRFETWLRKKPTRIYRDINVKSLMNYLVFEYKEYNLTVFDSGHSKNGYYYFYDYNFVDLIEIIKNASKTEIFKLSTMKKRGYHIRNTDKLEGNIEAIFID